MHIYRSINEPIRQGMSTTELWHGLDVGLIACWECGRQNAAEKPDLAKAAKNGELVPLPWKGGIETKIKAKRKYGTLNYLAMWQGLRGESLDIYRDREREIICSKFGVMVVFTSDFAKFGNA